MPDEITFKPRTAANRHVEDQATIDALRARVAELEAQVNEIPDLLLIAHMQGAEQAKDQIQALRAQIAAWSVAWPSCPAPTVPPTGRAIGAWRSG